MRQATRTTALVLLVVLSALAFDWGPALGQESYSVGDRVQLVERLRSDGTELGIPGHPAMGDSVLDYIIVSRAANGFSGLSGEEITAGTARVHTGLPETFGNDPFRRDLSDHLPVTVEVAVVADSD